MLRVLSILFFSLFLNIGYAQYTSKRVKKLKVDTLMILDTNTILPGSIIVKNKEATLNVKEYIINYETNRISILTKKYDTLTFIYNVFPYNLRRNYQLRDTSVIYLSNTNSNRNNFLIKTSPFSLDDAFGGHEIKKNGSVSRGINFGNNQNLGLNSSLNLELSGNLSPNLKLLASVSDANIPIQPEGTTSKLQEFDQLFIQIYNDQLKLIAGDFWLKSPKGKYMVYNKRAQGLTFTMEDKVKLGSWKTQESIALSKGKFNRQIIQGLEANQGPYRLLGAENEPFIILLAGTEKIFIDGKLLKRGQEFDYIIDYNTSELIFSSKNLITKDSRIVAEFQYTDQSYARSLLQSSTEFNAKKFQFWINGYSEQDAKNQNLQQDLSLDQKYFLSTVGDSINEARVSSINYVGYIPNQILYRMIDSIGYDSVLVFSNHPDSAFYRAYFEFVGENQGNYILSEQIALGKIYKWVEPIGGIPQGNYSPTRKLITPQKKQLFSSGLNYNLTKRTSVKIEGGLSNSDPNLFSNLNSNDNLGYVGMFEIANTTVLSKDSDALKWHNFFNTEILSKSFTPIQQFREVEFDRDWNVRGKNLQGEQIKSEINSQITHKSNGDILLKGQYFKIGEQFNGSRVFSTGKWNTKGYNAIWDGSYLLSQQSRNNQFLRHRLDLNKNIGKWKIGFKDDHEFNVFQISDSLQQDSYQFFDFQFYISNSDSVKNHIKLFYRERYDWKPNANNAEIELKKAAKGTTSGLEVTIKQHQQSKLVAIAGYRKLEVLDSVLIQETPENTAIGRMEFQWKTKKGDFSLNSFYEIGSGLEQKRDFVYLKVNDGQGIYAWIDYNSDGIEDLNEFEIAQFVDQANYIRIYVPSSDYLKTYNNESNLGVFWRPERRWKRANNYLKFLSIFSDQLRFRMQKKINAFSWEQLLNPIDGAISNPDLITTNSTLKNSFFINRTSSVFSAEYQVLRNQSKVLLASGFDARSLVSQKVNFTWNFSRQLNLNGTVSIQQKEAQVDYTFNRNFSQSIVDLNGEVSFQPNTTRRFGVVSRYANKVNQLGNETMTLQELGLNFKFNKTLTGSLLANFKFVRIDFQGEPNTAVSYDMLEALQPGNNSIWNISYQRLLSKNLQMSFSYLGRKSGSSRFIHTGGMELRAFF